MDRSRNLQRTASTHRCLATRHWPVADSCFLLLQLANSTSHHVQRCPGSSIHNQQGRTIDLEARGGRLNMMTSGRALSNSCSSMTNTKGNKKCSTHRPRKVENCQSNSPYRCAWRSILVILAAHIFFQVSVHWKIYNATVYIICWAKLTDWCANIMH